MTQAQLADIPLISEPLTWNEICERYPDEWVCLVEIDRPDDNNFAFRTARVVGHGKHPRDPFLQGHYFTGDRRSAGRAGQPPSVGNAIPVPTPTRSAATRAGPRPR